MFVGRSIEPSWIDLVYIPIHALSLNGDRPSTGTMLKTKLEVCFDSVYGLEYVRPCQAVLFTMANNSSRQIAAMTTSSNGNILLLYWQFVRGIHRWIIRTGASFAESLKFPLIYLRLNKWLGKQSWGWWFETPLRPLWRHRNDTLIILELESE